MDVKATRTDPTFTLTMSTDEAKMLVQIIRYWRLHYSAPAAMSALAFDTQCALQAEIQNAGVL